MANEFASIPEPTADPQSLLASVSALKQTVEALAGQRGTDASTAVTQADLTAQQNLAGVTPAVAIANLGIGAGGANAMFAVANNLSEGVAATIRTNIVAATRAQTDFISGLIKNPVNQDYRIVERMPYGATLTRLSASLASGTATITLKINTTAVGQGSFAVVPGASTGLIAPLTMVATDALVITVTLATAPVDLSFAVEFIRTLA